MEELFWQMGIGLAAILVVVLAYGALHSVVETKTGFEPFTRRKLMLLSAMASLYHGALYLHGQTGYLDGRPWAFPAMLAGAGALAVLIAVQNFKGAGVLWGAVVTAAQGLAVFVLGPMSVVLLAVLMFRSVTKSTGGGVSLPAQTPVEQPPFLYPNNNPY